MHIPVKEVAKTIARHITIEYLFFCLLVSLNFVTAISKCLIGISLISFISSGISVLVKLGILDRAQTHLDQSLQMGKEEHLWAYFFSLISIGSSFL